MLLFVPLFYKQGFGEIFGKFKFYIKSPLPPLRKGGDKKGGNCCKIPLNPPFSKGDVKSNG